LGGQQEDGSYDNTLYGWEVDSDGSGSRSLTVFEISGVEIPIRQTQFLTLSLCPWD